MDQVFSTIDPAPIAWGNDPATSFQTYDLSNYQPTLDTIAPGFTAQMTAQTGSPGEAWYTTAMRTASTLVMTDYQRKILNLQLQRAQNGQPPLDMSNFGVGVSVGMSPEVQKLVMLGVGAIVLVMLMNRRRA